MSTAVKMRVSYDRHDDLSFQYGNMSVRHSEKKLLSEFIREYIGRCHRSESYKYSYISLANHVDDFSKYTGHGIYTFSVSDIVMEDFVHYLQSELKLMSSSVKGLVERTKNMLQKAYSCGYKVNGTFKGFLFREDEVEHIYLTTEDIVRIYYYNGLPKNLEQIRDMFVIGCFTGLRLSDLSRLDATNFVEDRIVIRTKKTGTPVQIPMLKIVKEIVTKKYNYQLPKTRCAQYYNKMIKEVCKQVGLTEMVRYERKVGLEYVSVLKPRYELISSHTARRSAITNMHKEGIPTFSIMLIMGHKTLMSTSRYIRFSREENARMFAGHKYFN